MASGRPRRLASDAARRTGYAVAVTHLSEPSEPLRNAARALNLRDVPEWCGEPQSGPEAFEMLDALAECCKAQSRFKKGLAHMRLSRTSLPGIVERIRELIRAIEDPVGRTEAGEDMFPAVVIMRAGEKLLNALSPNGVNLCTGSDISDSTLDLKTKACLLDLHRLLTTFSWDHFVLDHKEQTIVSLEEVVRELEADPASAAVAHLPEHETRSGTLPSNISQLLKRVRREFQLLAPGQDRSWEEPRRDKAQYVEPPPSCLLSAKFAIGDFLRSKCSALHAVTTVKLIAAVEEKSRLPEGDLVWAVYNLAKEGMLEVCAPKAGPSVRISTASVAQADPSPITDRLRHTKFQ